MKIGKENGVIVGKFIGVGCGGSMLLFVKDLLIVKNIVKVVEKVGVVYIWIENLGG